MQSGTNFPAKRLSLFFETLFFLDASTGTLFSKYYIITYEILMDE